VFLYVLDDILVILEILPQTPSGEKYMRILMGSEHGK
jgi:hypothetical protein